MTRTLPLAVLLALTSMGCPNQDIAPLIGEDPEVYELIGAQPPDDPRASAVASARRLHQALIQGDTELAWQLLAATTRRHLDESGATIGVSGRELLDASTLPGAGGVVRSVRFEALFFGTDLVDMVAGPGSEKEAWVRAVAGDGTVTERRFVREDGRWVLAYVDAR